MVPPPPEDESSMSVETQLALLRVRVEQLIELNKTRGEDHESRLRRLEERRFPLQTVAVLASVLAMLVAVVGVLVGVR